MIYGYARVSSSSQTLEEQVAALTAAGCDVVRSEKQSGKTASDRAELQTLLAFLRAGDALVVTRIDRLARSMLDLQVIVHEIRQKGAALKATEQPVDTTTAAGKAFLDMLGVFAEFETNLRRERQMEGIAKAKGEGKYLGGKVKHDPALIRQKRESGMRPCEIAREMQCSERTVYNAISEVA